ncbi:MAG: helix-turn-helix domain-containing protein [Geminicoccaceae bacterium]
MDGDVDLLRLIGRRVGQRRAALGLSLDETAAKSGVSRAMVSRIERGEVHASAVVLDRLCAGLGISLSALFAREAEVPPLLRRAEQPVWRDPAAGYLRREVAPAGTGSPVKIVEIDFPAGAEVAFDPNPRRAIDQHLWLLEGEIEVATAGAVLRLAAGDCLHMRVADGNRFRNVGGGPARYAVILAVEPGP